MLVGLRSELQRFVLDGFFAKKGAFPRRKPDKCSDPLKAMHLAENSMLVHIFILIL